MVTKREILRAIRLMPVSELTLGLAESRRPNDNGSMIKAALTATLGLLLLAVPALAQEQRPPRLPFTATLSNNAPLAFGMTVEQAAAALNAPLKYIRGTPHNEVF